MHFLQPWVLLAGAAVAIPIILHLYRRRPNRMVFPALQFLREHELAVRRSLRLREILLLMLRILVILCLVLAFARPVWGPQVTGSGFGNSAVAFVFDTSVRMDYLAEGRTRLDQAKEAAYRLLGRLSPSTQVAIFDCRGGPVGYETDRAGALAKIRALRTLPGAMPVAAAALRACQLGRSTNGNLLEIVVFTDLTAPGWPAELVSSLHQQLSQPGPPRLWIVDVGIPSPRNFWLGDVEVVPQIASPGQLVRLRTTAGGTDAKSLVVELYVDELVDLSQSKASSQPARGAMSVSGSPGAGAPRSVATVEVGPQLSAPVAMTFSLKEAGYCQGVVKLASADGLSWDNERYFTVQVRPPEAILIATPPGLMPNSIYLRNMLAPEALAPLGQVRFHCQVVEQSRLLAELAGRWAAVVLLDPLPIDSQLAEGLLAFAENGGGLVLFLGGQAGDPVQWDTPVVRKLLPALPLRQARVPEGTYPRPESYQHPIFRPLSRYAEKLPWELAAVFRYWQVTPLGDNAQVLMKFADGGLALLERKVGKGRVILATTSLSDPPRAGAWNLFTAGECWPILAMVQEMLVYVISGSMNELCFSSGPRLTLNLPGEGTSLPRLLHRAGVRPPGALLLEQRGQLVEIPATTLAGNYVVELPGRRQENFRAFSVNVPASQTDLTRVDKTLREGLLGLPVSIVSFPGDLPILEGGEYPGSELSGYFLFAAVVLFVGELLFGNLFYGSRATTPAGSKTGMFSEPVTV